MSGLVYVKGRKVDLVLGPRELKQLIDVIEKLDVWALK